MIPISGNVRKAMTDFLKYDVYFVFIVVFFLEVELDTHCEGASSA